MSKFHGQRFRKPETCEIETLHTHIHTFGMQSVHLNVLLYCPAVNGPVERSGKASAKAAERITCQFYGRERRADKFG